ncbi:MAG: hypothetical protein E7530_03815 [Ruminococcaceae bacterium]|nr:hypothetical protein [Oscillospiraceae bacterium]
MQERWRILNMKLNYPKYEKLSEVFLKENENIKKEYLSYAECLNRLTKNGVQSGKVHNELLIYTSYVEKVPEMIDAISKKIKAFFPAYLDDMNAAQKFEGEYILYEENYTGTRDYTEEGFLQMQKDCDSIDSDANVFENIGDWWEDLIYGLLGFVGKAFNWWDARQTRYYLMEVNDIAKKQLNDIKDNLHAAQAHYLLSAMSIHDCIVDLKQYISILNEINGCDVGNFSMTTFALKLSKIYNEIYDTLDEVYVDEGISWKAVEKFIKTDDVEEFFDRYSVEVKEFLADLSSMDMKDKEFWLMTISQLFDVAIREMMGWVRKLFGDDYDYETYLYDNEMMALFDQMAKTTTFEDSEYKDILKDYQEFMELIKKYGDKWEEYLTGIRDEKGKLLLDKRTKNYKYFKEFFQQFENAENIIKYGTDMVEIMAALTADYEKNLEILNTVIDDCDPNSEMAKSLARIRLRYENSWENCASILKEKVNEWGDDFVKEVLKLKQLNKSKIFKFTNVFKVVGWVELAIDVVNETTGLGEESQAKLQLLTMGYEQIWSAEEAYANALAEVKECDPNSEEYQQCLKDFATSFEYYRLTLKRLYDKMALASSGDKQDYYRYCAEKFEQLNLENYEHFDVKTYEEYIAA